MFSSHEELKLGFAEIGSLLRQAKRLEIESALAKQSKNSTKEKHCDRLYSIIIRSAILFLSAKFELFLEEIADDYVKSILELNPRINHLPDGLVIAHIKSVVLDEHFLNTLHAQNRSCVDKVRSLHPIIDSSRYFTELPKIKFNYGKHGKNEVEKLFNRIGFNRIFEKCSIDSNSESFLGDSLESIDGVFNSLTAKRNRILHEDGEADITISEIRITKRKLWLFSKKLITELEASLAEVRSILTSNFEI